MYRRANWSMTWSVSILPVIPPPLNTRYWHLLLKEETVLSKPKVLKQLTQKDAPIKYDLICKNCSLIFSLVPYSPVGLTKTLWSHPCSHHEKIHFIWTCHLALLPLNRKGRSGTLLYGDWWKQLSHFLIFSFEFETTSVPSLLCKKKATAWVKYKNIFIMLFLLPANTNTLWSS